MCLLGFLFDKMKKIILSLFFLLLPLFGEIGNITFASEVLPKSTETFEGGMLKQSTQLKDYAGSGSGEGQVRNFMEVMWNFLQKLMIPLLIVLLTWAGVELFLSRGDEDKLKKKKAQVFATAVGFGIVILAVSLVERVFFGTTGEILVEGTDPSIFAKSGSAEIIGIINYVTTFVAAVAVAFLVYAVFRLIFGAEDDAELTTMKKQAIYSGIGIILIISSRALVEMFMTGGGVGTGGTMSVFDMARITSIHPGIVRWINIMLSVIAVMAVVSLIWGGIRMITHFGDDGAVEEGKKILLYSVIAIVLAFTAYTLARHFLSPGGMGGGI